LVHKAFLNLGTASSQKVTIALRIIIRVCGEHDGGVVAGAIGGRLIARLFTELPAQVTLLGCPILFAPFKLDEVVPGFLDAYRSLSLSATATTEPWLKMQSLSSSMPPRVLEFHSHDSESIIDTDPCSSSRCSPR
jgi:hypothetical protein